mgnify:CR=1 FL=1|jgi:hypothetical protein
MFLEKQLVDIKTFISRLAVLDYSEFWVYDQQQECLATEPKFTTKTITNSQKVRTSRIEMKKLCHCQ